MGYRDTARDGLSALVAFMVAIAIIGLIVVGGWQAGWWFHTQDTNRQAQLDKQGVGYQLPLQTQIGDEITQVMTINAQLATADPNTVGVLDTQRKATVANVCRQAAQVNPAIPLGGDQAQFVADNCFAGGIKPGSPYNH